MSFPPHLAHILPKTGIRADSVYLCCKLIKNFCVILLQQAYPSFWPEKSKMEKYGPVFSVHSVSRKHYQNIKQWEYKINKKVRKLFSISLDLAIFGFCSI